MSLTPLLDQLDELGDAGVELLAACEAVVEQARAEGLERERAQRRELLDERVAAFFSAYPDGSANRAHQVIGGTRAEILAAVRRVRTGSHSAVPGLAALAGLAALEAEAERQRREGTPFQNADVFLAEIERGSNEDAA